ALQHARALGDQTHRLDDVGVDPRLDQPHQPLLSRIDGVVHVEHTGRDVRQVDQDTFTRVPAPCSVNSSTSMAWGRRPSRITTASTPSRTAAMAVCSLGIMPPVATPSSISCAASATVIWRMISPSAPRTPATSVSNSIRLALSEPARAPATVSALTLKV